MQSIINYVGENSDLLFSHAETNTRIALFNNRGFSFTTDAQNTYDQIKNQPHLYVAWTNNENGYYYIGKSYQNGGRWKRQHAYHLGTLAYHLLNTLRYDDQNHAHWIKYWMCSNSMAVIGDNLFSIELKEEVYISFIPFGIYSDQDYYTLEKSKIRQINSQFERQLILIGTKTNFFLMFN
jgi:hypothetical protein